MKRVLEIAPEVFARLEAAATEDNCTTEEMAAHWLYIAFRTEAEIEAIEDEIDLEKAERVLAQSNSL